MLFKKFDKIPEFDFNKKHIKKEEKKPFIKFYNLLFAFVGIQIMFFSHNTFLLTNNLNAKSEETLKFFPIFKNLSEALKKGDDEKAINEFIKLKSSPFAVTDMLSSNIIRSLYIDETIEPNKRNKDSFNIKSETKKTLLSIYQNNINSGLNKEKQDIENIQCYFIDFSCRIFKPILKDTLIKPIFSIEKKLNIANYNISHPDEFKKWQQKINQDLENGIKNKELLQSPGDIYYHLK